MLQPISTNLFPHGYAPEIRSILFIIVIVKLLFYSIILLAIVVIISTELTMRCLEKCLCEHFKSLPLGQKGFTLFVEVITFTIGQKI